MLKNLGLFVSGFVLCFCFQLANDWFKFIPSLAPHKETVKTATNQGNTLAPIVPLVMLTNTISNKVLLTDVMILFTDDSNYRSMPFIFTQSNDNLIVRLNERSGGYKIKQWDQKENLISLYWNPLKSSYGAIYQRKLIFDLYGGVYADTAKNIGVIASWNW